MLVALSLGLWPSAALAADPVPDPALRAQEIQRYTRRGTAHVVGGSVGAVAGLCVMLVGRGEPGQISHESLAVSDLRSIGGAALLIGGSAFGLMGASQLATARALREEAEGARVTVAPIVDRRGGGLQIAATF